MDFAEVPVAPPPSATASPPSAPASVSAWSSPPTSSRPPVSPSRSRLTLPYVWIGFAVIEALALLGIAFGFIWAGN
jgi:hypothetical protein